MRRVRLREYIKSQNRELEESKKLLGKCFVFIIKYDPEMTPPYAKAELLTQIRRHLDGGTIQ